MSGTEGDTSTITNGELFRAVTLIRGDIGELRTDVKGKPTAEAFTYLQERVRDLENWQTWAMRLGIPSILASLLAAAADLAGRA